VETGSGGAGVAKLKLAYIDNKRSKCIFMNKRKGRKEGKA
jgi:hypothetical protein